MSHSRQEDSVGSIKALPKLRTTTEQLLMPTRSRTEPTEPEYNNNEKSHLHRRLQSAGLRNRAFTGAKEHKEHKEHGYRHAAKETVQSARELKPPISFDSLLRREKKGHESGRSATGRHVSRQQHEQQQRNVDEWAVQQAELARRRHIRPEDIEKAKKDNSKRELELRDSLAAVEEVAMSSTRQLDDTYYAILEKASLLRNTVASLQQLAEESRRMHSSFQEETKQLEQNTKNSFEGFANFAPQEKTISSLVDQLKHSKQSTDRLNDRLEAARHRVEAYEERERQKRKTSRQRWSVVWVTLAGLVVLIVAVVVAKNRVTVHEVTKALDGLGRDMSAMLKSSHDREEDSVLEQLFDHL